MRPNPPVFPAEIERRLRLQFRVTAGILLALPIGLAAFMGLRTPHYTRLLVTTPLGAGLSITALVLLICAGVAAWYVERRVRPVLRPVAMLPVVVFLIFPTLWIVLLGPAVVTIAGRR